MNYVGVSVCRQHFYLLAILCLFSLKINNLIHPFHNFSVFFIAYFRRISNITRITLCFQWNSSVHVSQGVLLMGPLTVTVRTLIAPNMFCVSEQGSLTIVRRSSTKKSQNHTDTVAGYSSSFADDETLDAVDLDTDNLPAVDTPDACDKAAVR